MPISPEGMIIAQCREALGEGRAVGTGIGLFGLMIREEEDREDYLKVLLRIRSEKESLYQQDLFAKLEMIGGGSETRHFETVALRQTQRARYQGSILRTLAQEFKEESGLLIVNLPDPISLCPAWHQKKYIHKDKKTKLEEERIVIDLAFSMPIPWDKQYVIETEDYDKKLKEGEIEWVPENELEKKDIVSLKTRFLIKEAIRSYRLLHPQ